MRIRDHLKLAAAAIGFTLGVAPASAAFIDAPLPTNAYITFGSLQWAWISPCEPTAPSCGDTSLFSYQGSQGWRLPTLGEFAARPQASDFLFAGANVPAGGSDPVSGATFFGANPTAGACATPYFSDVHRHCDFGDGVGGFIFPQSSGGTSETWAVRAIGGTVPEPATWAMLIGGFGLVGGTLRRTRGVRATVRFA